MNGGFPEVLMQHLPRWEDFAQTVLAMRGPMLGWLESAVGQRAAEKGMHSGASVKGRIRGTNGELEVITKYKLLPCDSDSRLPIPHVEPGVLVGIAVDACQQASGGDPTVRRADLGWVPPFVLCGAGPNSPQRAYYWILIPAHPHNRADNSDVLWELGSIIRELEGNAMADPRPRSD